MGKLDGKVAVITGSGSVGMGRATAILFAGEGARVVVADWDAGGGEETVKQINSAGGDAVFVQTNVAESVDVQRMINTAVTTYGKLDILFNNAAVMGGRHLIADLGEDEWDRVINIDLKGVFLGIKYGIPEMLKTGGGVIINTASAAGIMSTSKGGAYSIAKAGVIQLTKVAAIGYAQQNIRVNCICPQLIRPSGMSANVPKEEEEELSKLMAKKVPLQRMGKPEEIAQSVLFLASDESSYITGIALPVDGGSLAGII